MNHPASRKGAVKAIFSGFPEIEARVVVPLRPGSI
jgi:hypothetical protein